MEKILKEAIELHGEAHQRLLLVEELSELIKELCKIKRNKGDKTHLAEEIADVEIMIKQAFMMEKNAIGNDLEFDLMIMYASFLLSDYATDLCYKKDSLIGLEDLLKNLKDTYDLSDEVNKWKIRKLERLKTKMREDGKYD